MLQYKVVDKPTLDLLNKINESVLFQNYRLVGGTALALIHGHRKSIDLDFFGILNVEFDILIDELKTLGEVVLLKNSKNIHSLLINYIKPPPKEVKCNNG